MNSFLINGVHTHISISGYFRRKYAEIRKTGKCLFLTFYLLIPETTFWHLQKYFCIKCW